MYNQQSKASGKSLYVVKMVSRYNRNVFWYAMQYGKLSVPSPYLRIARMRFKMYQLTPDSLSYIVGRRCFQLKGESSRTPFGSRNRLEESVTSGCRIERPLPFETRACVCLLRGTERTSLWSLARVARAAPPSLAPLPSQRITANLLCASPPPSPRLSLSYPFSSSPRFFCRYVSHSIFSHESSFYT